VEIIKISKKAVDIAVKVLKEGGVVIYPTETLYGIGVDATNTNAISKLAKYKNRPFGKPYSIAVINQEMAAKYAELNSTADKIYKNFLPGPLTVVSKGKHLLAPGVESETGTLGIRIPNSPLVIDIVANLGKPITATSANVSYKKRPYKVSDILDNISERQKKLIDLIIDAGELPKNDPSTVIDTTYDDVVTLRQGEIKFSNSDSILSRSEENTQNLAKELWQKYESYKNKRSIIFALQGEMGTGKTQFTKGLAKAMGIKELITSPTFALENEYHNNSIKLFHFDAWRLEKSTELETLGFNKLIKDKEVVSIEWAERVADTIRKFDDEAVIIWVKIEFGNKDNERIITWINI